MFFFAHCFDCLFVCFSLPIVLIVFLRFRASDYRFGICIAFLATQTVDSFNMLIYMHTDKHTKDRHYTHIKRHKLSGGFHYSF
jgi:hypothetical protein